MFELADHIITEAEVLAAEMTIYGKQTMPIRNTGICVAVNLENRIVLYEFSINGVNYYITLDE